jgi:AcrR family transcriptional regulator
MDVRHALLHAAVKVFAETGTRGATTRRIAREAGVNEVTLFRHFRSKDDLMAAALEAFAGRAVQRALPDRPVDPERELGDWCHAHHRELHKVRALIRKSMGEFEQYPANCTHGMRASVQIADELTDYLNRLKRAGLATGDWDARAAAAMLMGAIFTDAIGRDTTPERFPFSMRQATNKYVRLLLDALGVARASRPAVHQPDRTPS